MDKRLIGAMEGGGTKFVCAVGYGRDQIVDEIRYLTTTPDETMARAIDFFKKHAPVAIGLAPFGPLDLNPASATYGHIPATPKAGWSGADILGPIQKAFTVPIAFELDVAAAAFGEYTWVPENRGLDSFVYYTIGTGIGAGIIINGKVVHGLTHPEAGHMRIPHDWQRDPFPGICPFHGDCLEGLATGPALKARWGQAGEGLSPTSPAWELEAEYIAAALVNMILAVSPRRIVLGGGVMQQPQLFALIRKRVKESLNGYVNSSEFSGDLDTFIVPPALGNRSAILGAIAMGIDLLELTA
jgi:fructokinase